MRKIETARRQMAVMCAGAALVGAACHSAAGAEVYTATPIKHLVVIFDENNSFDHYFGTYPVATNPPNEPRFVAADDTPTINGLGGGLLTSNPNSIAPFRLDRSQAALDCDNSNAYAAEQKAFDHGLMDKFPQNTSAAASAASGDLVACPAGIGMGYYDGNTVTALWNYAQHFAMSDNFFDTEFGTTVMGHLNLVSGQTHQTFEPGNVLKTGATSFVIRNGSVIANLDSALDDCKAAPVGGQPVASVQMTGANVGDLLNAKGIAWGWFYGDFTAQPGSTATHAVCTTGYDVHYDPFQYYPSTANPHHLPPGSMAMVGRQGDQANHQYDLDAFSAALAAGRLPAVTFLKAPATETGHPQTSDALSEQTFLVDTINALQRSSAWHDMAILIAYDDSDGWYDHVLSPILSQSSDATVDFLCGSVALPAGAYNDRCGYGQRLLFLVISPFAKRNYVDHKTLDTTSILAFIEDNWHLGRIDSLDHPNDTPDGNPPPGQGSFDRLAGSIMGLFDFDDAPDLHPLILDDSTGEVVKTGRY
ncbi:MAG TPA: alkaline phosphatase family protein [Stellaceae bacterium]|nr:alkaline phosphatase family protein [Stellaceae bacterium]